MLKELNGANLQEENCNNNFLHTHSMKYKFYHQMSVSSFTIVAQWFSIKTSGTHTFAEYCHCSRSPSRDNPIAQDIVYLSHRKFRNQAHMNLEVPLVVANFYNCGSWNMLTAGSGHVITSQQCNLKEDNSAIYVFILLCALC